MVEKSIPTMKLEYITALLPAIIIDLVAGYDFMDVIKGVDQTHNKYMIVNRIGQCIGFKNTTITLPDFRIVRYNKTYTVVNGEIIYYENFPKGYDIAIQVNKCEDFSSPTSCRRFMDLPQIDACVLFGGSKSVFSLLVAEFVPKIQCPIKKGTYVLRDNVPENGLVGLLPGSGKTAWELKFTSKHNDRQIMCFVILVSVRPLRTKN